jgi:hypothetical protein
MITRSKENCNLLLSINILGDDGGKDIKQNASYC